MLIQLLQQQTIYMPLYIFELGSFIFCCVGLRVIVFFNFRTFRSTTYFRHDAQLFFRFLPSSSVLVVHFILKFKAIGRFIL